MDTVVHLESDSNQGMPRMLFLFMSRESLFLLRVPA